MNRSQLVFRSLNYYWRTNLAVLWGVVAGTAVIVGALIVGDSIRASLTKMTLVRLGKIDFVLSGPRFVREALAEEISTRCEKGTTIAPAIVMPVGLQRKADEITRRAGRVSLYGFDERAWSLMDTIETPPRGADLILSASAAAALDAHVGDDVTLWVELPSVIPRDTLLAKKDNDSQEITLKISRIASEGCGLSRLGFQSTQTSPLNAFVDLHFLQERLGLEEIRPTRRDPSHRPARVNTLLGSGIEGRDPQVSTNLHRKYEEALRQSWRLADLHLKIVKNEALKVVVIESEQMIIEDPLAEAVFKTAREEQQPVASVLVYLANKIWNPQSHQPGTRSGYSMYSTIAGIDAAILEGTRFGGFEFIGETPASFGENDVLINDFLAADIQAKVGDLIQFSYHTIGVRGELPEQDRTVTVRGIVKMTGIASDPTLTPSVKGITDVDSLSNWDQPFSMDLDAVTTRDEEYWDSYRATPKVFLSLQQSQKLWPSRYGSLTSIRMGWNEMSDKHETATTTVVDSREEEMTLESRILQHVDPEAIGLTFQPVKAMGLNAANGSTDFSGLVIGFSLFLILAAVILIGLLFRLGMEQRVRELGLLEAIGFTPQQVRLQMRLEGLVVVVIGALLGVLVAMGYAALIIFGLTHWWIGAIGTKNLILDIRPWSLVLGFGLSLATVFVTIGWALFQFKGLTLQEKIAGLTEKQVDLATQDIRARRDYRRGLICSVLAFCNVSGMVFGVIPATGAFFGVGILSLMASLSFLSWWLQPRAGTSFSDFVQRETVLSSRHGTRGLLHPPALAIGGTGQAAFFRFGLRNASRQRVRSALTITLIATATFLIVAVTSFRRDPAGALLDKKSGNGGYTLVAESSSPVLYDINTAEGRRKLQMDAIEGTAEAQVLAALTVTPVRVKSGEDASCLNLYQTKIPTILGVPRSLIEEGRFAFLGGSWQSLLDQPADGSIPVLGDMNTLMFSLHKQVGQRINVPDDENPQHQLKISGMFQDSIFQGVLVMSEDNFLKLYPEEKGFRYFLIEVPPERQNAAAALLETELSAYGFDTELVAVRLARFLSVQNTYLSTFQALGGLGLLLGTIGLGTVMLRNVLERQKELALLRAVGYRTNQVSALVLWENGFVLFCGLFAGAASALLATWPNLVSRGADIPWVNLIGLMALVFVSGMLAATVAVRVAVRLPILTSLRGE